MSQRKKKSHPPQGIGSPSSAFVVPTIRNESFGRFFVPNVVQDEARSPRRGTKKRKKKEKKKKKEVKPRKQAKVGQLKRDEEYKPPESSEEASDDDDDGNDRKRKKRKKETRGDPYKDEMESKIVIFDMVSSAVQCLASDPTLKHAPGAKLAQKYLGKCGTEHVCFV